MFFTFETSQFEMSLLKDAAPMKTPLISVNLDTSHAPIDPCGPSEQSPFGDDFAQLVKAVLSSALDCGENKNSPVQKLGKMKIGKAKKKTWFEAVIGKYWGTLSS